MNEIGPYLPGMALTLTALGLGMSSPGPAVAAIMGASMNRGRRAGVALAFGIITGSSIWAVLAALGLAAVIAAHAGTLVYLRLAGGLYLLWLAFKAFRSVFRAGAVQIVPDSRPVELPPGALRRAYLTGLGVHLTNPKAVLVWAAAMTLGIDGNAPPAVLLLLVVLAALMSSSINLAYAFAFSSRPMVNLYARARRGIEFVFGSFFAAAALKLLTDR